MAFDFAYDPASWRATLTAPAPPGKYTLSVHDSLVDAASSQSLDGEPVTPALPSGDGEPGGSFVMMFIVLDPAPAADLTGGGAVDGADLAILLGRWGLRPPPCTADLNVDGAVDGQDLAILLGDWG